MPWRRFAENFITSQSQYFAAQVFVPILGREDYARSLSTHEEPAHHGLAGAR